MLQLKQIKQIGVWLLFSSLFLFTFNSAVLAAEASLSLSPRTQSVEVGETLSLDVVLNTDGAPVSSVDVVLQYPTDKLEYVSATAGSILPTMVVREDTPGTLRINLTATTSPFEGTGTLVTVDFKAKAQGTAAVTFVFVAGSTTSDSNVNSNNSDILSVVSGGEYTITAAGTGSGDTTTTTTTTTTNTTPTPTPADGIGGGEVTPTLPVTGFGDSTASLLAMGLIFLFLGAFSWALVR